MTVDKGGMTLRVFNPAYPEDSSPIDSVCRSEDVIEPFSDVFAVDWSGASFVSTSQMTAVASIQRMAHEVYNCSLGYTPARGNAGSYMSCMGYEEVVSDSPKWKSSKHGGDNYSTLMPIDDDGTAQDVAESIAVVLRKHLSLDETVRDAIDYAVGEMIDNVLNHSDSSGFASAQYIKARGFVDLCVADSGIGIGKTMSRNDDYKGLSSVERVMKAFEEGAGENTRPESLGFPHTGAGRGLSVAAGLVRATKGHIWVVSRHDSVTISCNEVTSDNGMYYPGTVIAMRVPVGKDVTILQSDLFSNGKACPFGYSTSEGIYDASSDSNNLW